MELDRAAVDRVLRRASELGAARPDVPDAGGRGMSEAVLFDAALEAGLDPDAVRTSLAIERLGPAPTGSRLDRTLGPHDGVVDRIIALDLDTLLGRIDDLLQRQHGLRRTRSAADWGEWRRRTDTIAKVQRSVARMGSSSAELRRVSRIEARASRVDDQRTLVRLVADRRPQRSGVAAGGGAVGGIGLLATGAAAVVVAPAIAAAAPVAVVAGVVVARTGRRQHVELVADLEMLLDTVERGLRPVTLTDDVRRMLRQLRG